MSSLIVDVALWERPFNSPLEAGLRAVAVLIEAFPMQYDVQRLLQFDYMLVHSGDVPGGPPSLHPPTPHRSGELLVRRGLVERGLALMLCRGLVEQRFDSNGIIYCASESAAAFLGSLESPYTLRLRERAHWLVSQLGEYTQDALDQFVQDNLDKWGAEFASESVVREIPE